MSYNASDDIWAGTWHAEPRGQQPSNDSVSKATYVLFVLGSGRYNEGDED